MGTDRCGNRYLKDIRKDITKIISTDEGNCEYCVAIRIAAKEWSEKNSKAHWPYFDKADRYKSGAKDLEALHKLEIVKKEGEDLITIFNQRCYTFDSSAITRRWFYPRDHVNESYIDVERMLEEIMERFNDTMPVSLIGVGCIVEIVTGAFKGEKARVTSVSETKEEVGLELYEQPIPMTLKMRGDHVRFIERVE